MHDIKTDEARRQLLTELNLDPDAAGLADESAPAKRKKSNAPVLAPDGVNPHSMPVTAIVFDERLLDNFPVLEGSGLKAASDFVFSQYRAVTASGADAKDKDRHSLLHGRITKFIGEVRRSRATGGYVREKVKATKEQREMAALLAGKGITAADLAKLLTGGE